MKVPPFTLVQLRYFAAAVECGSMTAASRELMVSQSAVSTAIAQLERTLGVTLVLRHHAHGLALTGAGRAFHAELKRALGAGECEVALAYGYDLEEDLVSTHIGSAPPYPSPLDGIRDRPGPRRGRGGIRGAEPEAVA